MPSSEHVRVLLLSCAIGAVATRVSAAGSNNWSSSVFNTLRGPRPAYSLAGGGESFPQSSLRPPSITSGFGIGFSPSLGTASTALASSFSSSGTSTGASTLESLAKVTRAELDLDPLVPLGGAVTAPTAPDLGRVVSPVSVASVAGISPRTLSFGFTSPASTGLRAPSGTGSTTAWLGARPQPQPQPLQTIKPSQVRALAEGAGKFFARTFKAFSARPAETVRFDLYTRQQPTTPTRIYARNRVSVEQSTFTPSQPTKILIHGFLSHQGPGTGGEALKNAFLWAQDCNVVTVDWSGADPREYSSAVSLAVPRVSGEVAELLRLLSGLGADLDDVHIVGHSLGSQIAGAAASQVFQGLGRAGRVGRVTGMDPAGPLFEGRDAARRLDPTDARFVDVIHTDGGMLGYAGATGHADFFPDGGMHVHPGCGKDLTGICSHCVVYDILIDALRRPGGAAYRGCASWQAYKSGECDADNSSSAVIGLFTDPRSRGSFFLATNGPIREELRVGGDKDLIGLLSIRRDTGGRDGVVFLQC